MAIYDNNRVAFMYANILKTHWDYFTLSNTALTCNYPSPSPSFLAYTYMCVIVDDEWKKYKKYRCVLCFKSVDVLWRARARNCLWALSLSLSFKCVPKTKYVCVCAHIFSDFSNAFHRESERVHCDN